MFKLWLIILPIILVVILSIITIYFLHETSNTIDNGDPTDNYRYVNIIAILTSIFILITMCVGIWGGIHLKKEWKGPMSLEEISHLFPPSPYREELD